MQPDNNAQNNVGAEIDAALKSAEASPQENVMAAGTADDKKNDEKSKMSKKQIVGLVVLSLIAIGGVLFGVYGMNSQNEQIAQLTVRATDAERKVSSLETGKTTISDLDKETADITDSATINNTELNTKDYIYIGEWGIKINEEGEYLYINGMYGDGQTIPSYINTSIKDAWLICLSRYPKGFDISTLGASSPGGLVYSDDGYDYYVSRAQAYNSENEADTESEIKTVNAIEDVLRKTDSYSSI